MLRKRKNSLSYIHFSHHPCQSIFLCGEVIICWCVFVHGPSTGPALQLISDPCTTHVVLYIVCAGPYVPFHAPTALTKNQRAFYALSWKRAAAGAWNNHGGVFCEFLIQYLGFIPFLDLATFLFGSSVKRPCKFRCYNLIEITFPFF